MAILVLISIFTHLSTGKAWAFYFSMLERSDQNCGHRAQKWGKCGKDSILVVDGQSSDNTLKLANEAGATVISQKKKGKGAAMIEAIDGREEEVFVFIDGDGTYLPFEFKLIVDPVIRGEADMVIGSRFKGKIEVGAIHPLNYLGNKFLSLVTTIIFGTNISDIFRDIVQSEEICFKKSI